MIEGKEGQEVERNTIREGNIVVYHVQEEVCKKREGLGWRSRGNGGEGYRIMGQL